MPNLQIILTKSNCLISLFCGLYGIVLLILGSALWLHWLPIWVISILFLITGRSFYRAIHFFGLRKHPRAICQIRWDTQNGWILHNNQGAQFCAKLCGDSFTTSHLLLLHFKTDSERFFTPVLITSKCIKKELFRRLFVLTMIISG